MMPNPYLLAALGVVTGFVGGLAGVGGGIVIIPALVYFFGFSQHQAQGSALGMLAIPVSLLAAWTYHKEGMVDVRVVGLLALGFIIGSYGGAKLALSMPNLLLQRTFGTLLIVVGIRMVFFAK